MEGGGYKTGGGEACEVLHLGKGGGGEGHTKFWGCFCVEACGSFSHIEGGVGVQKVYTL